VIAPIVNVVLLLLCFFLLTWNLSRYEQDIAVKVPTARHWSQRTRRHSSPTASPFRAPTPSANA